MCEGLQRMHWVSQASSFCLLYLCNISKGWEENDVEVINYYLVISELLSWGSNCHQSTKRFNEVILICWFSLQRVQDWFKGTTSRLLPSNKHTARFEHFSFHNWELPMSWQHPVIRRGTQIETYAILSTSSVYVLICTSFLTDTVKWTMF